ncbi:MAG TPA: large-conductance mechanosensitive channel protein MscL [Steroidobacteraceae bacterium]|nr:large-conductance mechanosensitive channel protein MscL [Steroidobacteraceae bacterium]
MSLLQEFKEFAMKGNMIDMAVGIVIGAAFGKIVSSLVEAIIMPALGWVIGGVDFSSLVFTLGESAKTGDPVTIGYGAFMQSLVDFLIIAAAIFMALKAINKLKKPAPAPAAAPPPPPRQEVLLAEIRDLLKQR